jgi:hypothetical protein
MNTTTTLPAIDTGSRVRIEKGCAARQVTKGTTAVVRAVEALGAEYSHSVKVTLQFVNGFGAGRVISFYARHPNRLSDAVISMNDGNPTHRIEVRRA